MTAHERMCYNVFMDMYHTSYQLRGYMSRSKRRRVQDVLRLCAELYNAALEERRDTYGCTGKSVSLYNQVAHFTRTRKVDPRWNKISVQVGRGVLRRLDRAFNGFFRRVKSGDKPGYPRFKPAQRYTCIEIAETTPGMLKIGEHGKAYVKVKGLPTIEIRPNRELPPSSDLKSLRINLRQSGVDVNLGFAFTPEPLSVSDSAVGLDVGVSNRVALSDGRMIESREPDRKRERRLRRAISRSQKGSNTRRRRVLALSRVTRKNTVRNRNMVHEVTTGLIQAHGRIAMEKLVIPNMTRDGRGTIERPGVNVAQKRSLNRRILDQTWGMIREQLRYKAEWAGREFIEVDPKYTSRICHSCGHSSPQSEYRTYRCGVCGMVMDRDTNAALNVMARAFGTAGVGMSPGVGKLDDGLGSET